MKDRTSRNPYGLYWLAALLVPLLAVTIYVGAYFALSGLSARTTGEEGTFYVRVFGSQEAYVFFEPLRRIEAAVNQRRFGFAGPRPAAP